MDVKELLKTGLAKAEKNFPKYREDIVNVCQETVENNSDVLFQNNSMDTGDELAESTSENFFDLMGDLGDDLQNENQKMVEDVFKAVKSIFEYMDNNFGRLENEFSILEKKMDQERMSKVVASMKAMRKAEEDGEIYSQDKQSRLSEGFNQTLTVLEGTMQGIVETCEENFPEEIKIKDALDYVLHFRKRNVKNMEEEIKTLKSEWKVYRCAVLQYIKLEWIYRRNIKGAKFILNGEINFLRNVFKIENKNRIYTFTEDNFWLDEPKKFCEDLKTIQKGMEKEDCLQISER